MAMEWRLVRALRPPRRDLEQISSASHQWGTDTVVSTHAQPRMMLAPPVGPLSSKSMVQVKISNI